MFKQVILYFYDRFIFLLKSIIKKNELSNNESKYIIPNFSSCEDELDVENEMPIQFASWTQFHQSESDSDILDYNIDYGLKTAGLDEDLNKSASKQSRNFPT